MQRYAILLKNKNFITKILLCVLIISCIYAVTDAASVLFLDIDVMNLYGGTSAEEYRTFF